MSKRQAAQVLSPEQGAHLTALDLIGDRRHLAAGQDWLMLQQDRLQQGVKKQLAKIMQGQHCTVSCGQVHQYDEAMLGANTSVCARFTGQSSGVSGLRIERAALYQLAEAFYGQGSPSQAGTQAADANLPVSNTELRLLQRLLKQMLTLLFPEQQAWHSQPQQALESHGLLLPLSLHFGEQQTELQLLLGATQVASVLTTTQDTEQPIELTEQLEKAVEQIPFQLNFVLARRRIALGELLNLQPGDIVPLELPELCEGGVDSVSLYRARVLEHQGGLVAQLEDDI